MGKIKKVDTKTVKQNASLRSLKKVQSSKVTSNGKKAKVKLAQIVSGKLAVPKEILNVVKAKAKKAPASTNEESSNDILDPTKLVQPQQLEKAITALITLAKGKNKKNQLFSDPRPLFLQINCFKVPKGQSKLIRMPLKHSMLSPKDSVCLIVADVKTIKNIEHEKHVEHYQELLRKRNVQNISKIMTYHELRTEYDTFELKKRLVDLYDQFLVDGRISGRVAGKCGQIFFKKRKIPNPVRLQDSKLKERIEEATRKVQLHLHCKGDSYVVQFGHSEMLIEHLVENCVGILEDLKREFPGGYENFRRVDVLTQRALSIPVYLSLKSPNEVAVPKIEVKRPKAYKSYTGELSTKLFTEVKVNPSGKITCKRMKKKPKPTKN